PRFTCAAVGGLLLRPMQELRTVVLEMCEQILCAAALFQSVLFTSGDVIVNKRNGQLIQAKFCAKKMAIYARLGPMSRLLVLSNGFKRAAKGLDFFQTLLLSIEPVSPAAHEQIVAIMPFKHQLGLVIVAASSGNASMPRHAFLSGRCSHKTQVEISAAGSEFA